MSTVAPSNEKQTLQDELAQARALVEDGEYEAALDHLTTARELAQEQGDAEALREARGLGPDGVAGAPRLEGAGTGLEAVTQPKLGSGRRPR